LILCVEPTVETGGYFRSSRRDFLPAIGVASRRQGVANRQIPVAGRKSASQTGGKASQVVGTPSQLGGWPSQVVGAPSQPGIRRRRPENGRRKTYCLKLCWNFRRGSANFAHEFARLSRGHH
jgi:hypothetical protein